MRLEIGYWYLWQYQNLGLTVCAVCVKAPLNRDFLKEGHKEIAGKQGILRILKDWSER